MFDAHTHDTDKSAEYDSKGIFLCFTCGMCRREKLSGYNPAVLNDEQLEFLGIEASSESYEQSAAENGESIDGDDIDYSFGRDY